LAQAKSYAGKLRARFGYATNGQRIYGVDMQNGTEGDVTAYPSPDKLWNLTFAEENDWRERLPLCLLKTGRVVGFALLPRQRDQQCAGSDCGKSAAHFADTGDGNGQDVHRVSVGVEVVSCALEFKARCGTRPRILFLADRNILADQAYNSFSAFEDSNPGSLVAPSRG